MSSSSTDTWILELQNKYIDDLRKQARQLRKKDPNAALKARNSSFELSKPQAESILGLLMLDSIDVDTKKKLFTELRKKIKVIS